MNSGELGREDFGFSVALGSISQPLAVPLGKEGFKKVNCYLMPA